MARKEKNLMMLVNPSAGRSLAEQMLGSAVAAFCSAGYTPTVYFTTGPGSASDITAHYAPGYERLVCLGGDGTLSDVVAGLMRLAPEERPHIGYIPMGTANDVANTLELPMRQPQQAVQKILRGKPLNYDVGEMDGVGYFTYIAAFGAFTEVSYKTDQELKRALGHAAYVLEAISTLSSLRSYHAKVEYDDGAIEGQFIYGAVSNAISVGGVMKMDPSAVDLSDGKVEILLVHEPKGPAEINSIVTGIIARDYTSSPCLTLLHSENVRFTFDEPVPWTRDGEDGGEHVTLDLHCRPHAVRIFC